MKRFVIASVVSACVFSAGWRVGAQTPTSQPAAPKPVAVINGHEIDNDKFNQLLMQVTGLRVFEDVLNWTLVQQACDQAGIRTDGEDFTKLWHAELQRVLDGFGAKGVPEEDRPKVLQGFLQQKGISEVEFQMSLQQTAGLRALSKGHVEVTDDEIKRQFDSDYGDKVDVRIITIKEGAQPALLTASKVREAVEKEKKDPTEVAKDLQLPIEPLTIPKNADNIKEIRDTAFQLKPGQLSASVQKNGVNFLIYLDKVIPARTDVKFEAEKEKVRGEVMAFKENQWMQNHLAFLRQNARVNVNDPILAQQFQAIAAQMRANAAATQAAATQPAAPAK
jgi:hypothetical protein